MPIEPTSLDDLKWEDSAPVENPPLEDMAWEESEPIGEIQKPSDVAYPKWEESEPLTPADLEGIQISRPPAFTKAPPPKTLWENTKEFLRGTVAPLFGATDTQAIADAKALMSADPEAVKDLFDEKGELTTKGSNAWTSLMRGVDQLQGLGYGLGMLGSDLVGADRLSSWLKDRMMANQAQIEANPPAVGTMQRIGVGYPGGPAGALPRLRQTMTYGVEAITENLPSMGLTVGAGTITGALAKKLITRGLEKTLIEKALETQARKVLAAQALGTYATTTGMEAGGIYADMVGEGIRGPVPAMVAAAGGMVAGVFDAIGPLLAVRRVGAEPLKSPIEKWIRSTMGEAFAEKGLVRLGMAGFEGAMVEGPTEYLQTAIEQAARLSQDPKVQGRFWETFWNSYQLQMERRESFAKGAIAGGAMMGAGETIGLARRKLKTASDRAAFDLGLDHAMARLQGPRQTIAKIPGQAPLPIEVPRVPSVAPPTVKMPEVAGVMELGLVRQALNLGLEKTASAVAGQTGPLTAPVPQPEVPVPQPEVPVPQPEVPVPPPLASATPPKPDVAVMGTSTIRNPQGDPLGTQYYGSPEVMAEWNALQARDLTEPGVWARREEIKNQHGGMPPLPRPPAASITAPAAQPAPVATRVVPTAPRPMPAPAQAIAERSQAQELRGQLSKMFPNLGGLEVVDTAEGMPDAVKQDAIARGYDINALDAIYYGGRVIFNASKFPVGNADLVFQKVVHEAAIHLGLREVLGADRFRTLAESVWRGLSPAERQQVADRNHIALEDIGQIGEEWLAYEAERVALEGKSNPLWARIAALIRAGFRKLGFDLKLSDVEIASLVAKGFEGAQAAVQKGTYPAPSPLASVDSIRFSFAEVERTRLEGLRFYVPETRGADMENAFSAVKKMLYIEAKILSDLIPPQTPWHQPKPNQSLIEYLRQFYSPQGIELLRQTFAGDRPPTFIKDKPNWYRVKKEISAALVPETRAREAKAFLAGNRKTGGVSWDFGLGTCLPTEACSVCYAKGTTDPVTMAKARTRHSIVTALYPNEVGLLISQYVASRPKGELPFLRINGAGDTTFPWQATAVNTVIRTLDRPVHIFSRSHVSRATGTIGLDSIDNGWFNEGDVENGVAVYKMGSIDRQLMDEYGIPFLRDNLAKRNIINSYLVKDVQDIPRLLELARQGVFFVMHINATKEVIRALNDAGLIGTTKNIDEATGLIRPACPCALESGPFLNGCATCLVGGGPCFSMGSQMAMTGDGQMIPLAQLLSGKMVPPAGRLAEMSRVGVPRDPNPFSALVAARAYELAATDIIDKIAQSQRTGSSFTIQNPRDRTPILRVQSPAQRSDARQIAADWREYAKGLRELARTYEQGSGFQQLLAQKRLAQVKEEQQALTEGISAMNRAVEPVIRTSMTEGPGIPPEPAGRAVPGVASPGGPGTGIEADPLVQEHDREFVRRFSITPLAVKNEDMEAMLAGYGMPPVSETLGKPDAELLRNVERRMRTELGWVDSIVSRETKQPGLLTDEETLALDLWLLHLRYAYENHAQLADQAEKAGQDDLAAVERSNAEYFSTPMQELAELLKRAGTEAGRAFRARQMAVNLDFTLPSLINQKRQALGWRKLTESEVAELEKTAKQFRDLNEKLEAENRKLREREVDKSLQAAQDEVARISPDVLQFAKEWVQDVQQRAKNAKDRFKVKWQRLFPDKPIRLSLEPGAATPTLPDELMRELAIMGGAKLAQNITDQAEWEAAMVDEIGESIKPYLAGARSAAEAWLAQRLAEGRSEMALRRAPRKVPAAPGVPAGKPTIEERMAVTKAKIGQVVEKRKASAEPTRTAEDDLYYPVQQLIRELVEQDPIIGRDDLVTAVHEVLLESMPEITREETMDAISGRGRIRKPDPETVARTIRDLKAQIRIAAHILDVEAGRPLKRTGYQFDKPSEEQQRLVKQLNNLRRRLGEVVTDPAAQLASYLDSRKTWYRNRIADLQYEIANRELIVRQKAAGQTDPELEALKAEYDHLRREHDEIFVRPDLTPEDRLALAERAAERIILKLEKDLAQGRITANRQPSKLASAKLEALRTRIVQLKAEQEWAQRHMNPPPDLTDPADIRRWFTLDKSIRKIEEQLAGRTPFQRGKTVQPVDTPTNQAMVARLEDLKRQRKEMQDRSRPAKRSPLEQAIYNRMGQLRRQIADYETRLADRDFAPRPKREPVDLSSDPEAVKLLARRDRAVQEFNMALEKDRYERKSSLEKIWLGIRQTPRTLVNLVSSFDFSGLRQGLVAMGSLVTRMPLRPFTMTPKVAKIFVDMFKSAFSRQQADQIMAAIKMRPNWKSGADKIGKVAYTDIDAPTFSRAEENARSLFDEWARKPLWQRGRPVASLATLPGRMLSKTVAGSNRAFATFLNATRATLWDALLEANFKDRPPTENELRILGNWVNVATGRGPLNPKVASAASTVMWAPKLLASRVAFVFGQPLWGGGTLRDSARARRIVATEYARVLASAALVGLVASLFDEKKERDLRSSDAFKIVRGNTRIDLWGGFQQLLVFLARGITASKKTLGGEVVNLASPEQIKRGAMFMVLANFLRTKLRPDVGIAVDLWSRGGFRGEPVTPSGVAEDLLMPLPTRGIVEIMKDRGIPEGLALEALNQFGMGVSVYEPTGKPRAREVRTQ